MFKMSQWLGLPIVEDYGDLKISQLPLNYAYVIANTSFENVGVYSVPDDCLSCPYKLERRLNAGEEVSWQIDTSVPGTWRLVRNSNGEPFLDRASESGLLCYIRPTLGEYGVYRLNVGSCELKTEVSPVNTYLPFFLFMLSIMITLFTVGVIKVIVKRRKKTKISLEDEGIVAEVNKNKWQNTPSLHLMRGILMTLLIFVTSGGGGYPVFFRQWGSLSVADYLLFVYAWTIGVNIPVIMDKAFRSGKMKFSMIRDIIMRAFTIVVLGVLIESTVSHHQSVKLLWCPLERLGVAYLVVASAYVLTVQKFEMRSKKIACKALTNLMTLLWCWIVGIFFLALLIVLTSIFVSFNCQATSNMEEDMDMRYNITSKIYPQNCNSDISRSANLIFTAEDATMVFVNGYFGFKSGIMGFMSTIIFTMIGLKAGTIYLNYGSHGDRLKLWSIWATLFAIGGMIFASVSVPLSFNLWPIATILVFSATAFYILSFVYTLAEIFQFTNTTLSATGVTSIAILAGHLLFSKSMPFSWQIYFSNHLIFLVQNVWTVGLWLIVGIVMMKKKGGFSI